MSERKNLLGISITKLRTRDEGNAGYIMLSPVIPIKKRKEF
jgi:hypothetical protein